jgi:hypothetical protein
MRWIPLLVVLGLLVGLLLVNLVIRGRSGHRLIRTSIQGDIFGGLSFFLLIGSIFYEYGSSPLRAYITSSIGGVGFSLISRWQRRRRITEQRKTSSQ